MEIVNSLQVSKPLKVGDLRRHQHMNVIIDFEAKATLTILFFREEVIWDNLKVKALLF